MFTSQAVADLALMLTGVTTAEHADRAIKQALRSAGLLDTPTMDEADMNRLLVALAAQGGLIEQLAVQIAVDGLGASGTSTGMSMGTSVDGRAS